jgi:transposase
VASKGIVTTDEIERMFLDASQEDCDSKPKGLKRLGIDEIAIVKGKGNYCAVLIDLDRSKLIEILSGRTQEIIKKTLIGWGSDILDQIE